MEEKLLMRSEVPVNETWDLSLIFKSEEEMDASLTEALALARHITETCKGKLTDAKTSRTASKNMSGIGCFPTR